jgi:hypothetical protein
MAEAEEKLKPSRAILETIRERAGYALKTTSRGRRGTFDAMAMQRLPLGKKSHSTSSIRVG